MRVGDLERKRTYVWLAKLDRRASSWHYKRWPGFDSRYGHSGCNLQVADDGTVLVVTRAEPLEESPTTTIRVEVAIKRPRGGWMIRKVSRKASDAWSSDPAINADGEAVVTFVESTEAGKRRLRAATLTAEVGSRWNLSTPAHVGDNSTFAGQIGPEGTVAVLWQDTSWRTPGMLTLATAPVGNVLWSQSSVAGTTALWHLESAVDPLGRITVIWVDNPENSTGALYARQLEHGIWTESEPRLLTSPTILPGDSSFRAAPLPDGRLALAYAGWDPDLDWYYPSLWVVTVDRGQPVEQVQVLDHDEYRGSGPTLASDASGAVTMSWTQPSPGWVGSDSMLTSTTASNPTSMTQPSYGEVVTQSRVTGPAVVGERLWCRDGYWVEAAGVTYRWMRNGRPIEEAVAPLTAQCDETATRPSPALQSPRARQVRQRSRVQRGVCAEGTQFVAAVAAAERKLTRAP